MNVEQRLKKLLLFMRLAIFVVMLMWALDKYLNPEHARAVYTQFYFLESLSLAHMKILGVIEMIFLVTFLVGLFKFFTYGLVFVFHGISTLSTLPAFVWPFDGMHLWFFAAWPMLVGCYMLFVFRDLDTKGTLGK